VRSRRQTHAVTRFVYDGDGQRVAQVTASDTTIYLGQSYERTTPNSPTDTGGTLQLSQSSYGLGQTVEFAVTACEDYATSQPWQLYATPATGALTETLLYSPDGQAAWGDPVCGASWTWDQALDVDRHNGTHGPRQDKCHARNVSLAP
jgi:YD repeat-containing protein